MRPLLTCGKERFTVIRKMSEDVKKTCFLMKTTSILCLQFKDVPKFYEETYLTLARQGARVIALGYKPLGTLTHSQVSHGTIH